MCCVRLWYQQLILTSCEQYSAINLKHVNKYGSKYDAINFYNLIGQFLAREFKPFEMFQSDWLTTDTSQFSHPLHILETKFMFEHVHIRYCNTIGWWLIISFTSVTDISDFIHPLNRGHVWSCSGKTILVDHVQVRLYWKISC